MKFVKMASDMGKLAGELCKGLDMDAVAIVLLKDNKVAAYFGSSDKFTKEMMSELLKSCSEHFAKMAPEIASGGVKPIKLSESDNMFLNNPVELPPNQNRSN